MILTWKQVVFCSFTFVLAGSSIQAQRTSRGGGVFPTTNGNANANNGPIFGQPSLQPSVTTMQPGVPNLPAPPKPQIVEDESCLPWSLSDIRGATVNVARLAVPDKARSEFDKACSDFKKKKFADAETHVRSAIEKYSNYVAAWVMLGQVLAAQQQAEKAHDACSQAEKADPSYLPPYLCLAELDVKSGQWDEILNVTKMAMGLNPGGDVYAYFYRAIALFNLNQLPEAEKTALQAEGIDAQHHDASVHYLLGQIYEAKGDLSSAVAEVKEFLKMNSDKGKVDEAKQYLARLQGQDSPKQEAVK
jgi:tetratricopeptide (TPR) repeat protein